MLNDSDHLVRAQLTLGETLLWSGRPRQGIIVKMRDVVIIPFLLFGGIFAWMFIKSTDFNDDWMRFVFGGVWISYAVFVLFGRFLIDRYLRSKTYYGLTNERAIVVSGFFSRSVSSVSLKYLLDLSIDENKDGTGCLRFGPRPANGGFFSTNREDTEYQEFREIPDVRKVYDQAYRVRRELQYETTKTPTFEQIAQPD